MEAESILGQTLISSVMIVGGYRFLCSFNNLATRKRTIYVQIFRKKCEDNDRNIFDNSEV